MADGESHSKSVNQTKVVDSENSVTIPDPDEQKDKRKFDIV